MSEKRILITGADGFVGRNLILKWAKRFSLQAFVLPGKKASFESFLRGHGLNNVTIVVGSFEEPEAVARALHGAELVIHCVGNMFGSRWEAYERANVGAVRALLDQLPASVKRVILLSSQAVQGPGKDKEKLKIGVPCEPRSFYGKSKLAGERVALEHPTPVPITILRPCSIYGAYDTCFFDLFKLARKGLFGTLFDKEKYFQLIHVDDLVAAIEHALDDNEYRGLYFIAPSEVLTWWDLLEALSRIEGRPLKWVNLGPVLARIYLWCFDLLERLTGRPTLLCSDKAKDMSHKYWLCDSTPFSEKFGFTPSVPLSIGMQRTRDWYLGQEWLR